MRPIEITCERRRRERRERRYLLASTTFRFGFHHAVNENELSVLRFAVVEEEQKGVRIARRHIPEYYIIRVCPFLHLHHLELFSPSISSFSFLALSFYCTRGRSARTVNVTVSVSVNNACKSIYFENNSRVPSLSLYSLSSPFRTPPPLSLFTEITAAPSLPVVRTDLAFELVPCNKICTSDKIRHDCNVIDSRKEKF